MTYAQRYGMLDKYACLYEFVYLALAIHVSSVGVRAWRVMKPRQSMVYIWDRGDCFRVGIAAMQGTLQVSRDVQCNKYSCNVERGSDQTTHADTRALISLQSEAVATAGKWF